MGVRGDIMVWALIIIFLFMKQNILYGSMAVVLCIVVSAGVSIATMEFKQPHKSHLMTNPTTDNSLEAMHQRLNSVDYRLWLSNNKDGYMSNNTHLAYIQTRLLEHMAADIRILRQQATGENEEVEDEDEDEATEDTDTADTDTPEPAPVPTSDV